MSEVCASAAALGYEPGSLKARIAAAAEASCAKHAQDLPSLPMGTTAKQWRKANKKRSKLLKQQVRDDVVPQFSQEKIPDGESPPSDVGYLASQVDDYEPGDPAGFFFAFMSIGYLIEVVVSAVISWYIERCLTKKFGE